MPGWTPSTFVSSRGQKAEICRAKPEDFMDEEVRKIHPPPTYLLSEHKGDGDKHKLFKQLHLAFIYIHIHVGGPGLKSVFGS